MGPVLLCDKSTIQSLHRHAPDTLHRYFTIAVPSILVFEILGDLTKKEKAGGPNLTRELAHRIAAFSTVPLVDFRHLIAAELNGTRVRMDHRPQLSAKRVLQSDKGEYGIEIAEDPCEELLHRWRRGDFSHTDVVASTMWRNRKERMNWRHLLLKLEGIYSPSMKPKKSFEEVTNFVEDLIAAEPRFLRSWFLREFDVLKNRDFPTEDEALVGNSYLIFCIRITLFALWSMKFDLLSTKADNQLDLEYLFYLPFTNAFTAQDRFPKRLASLFLRGNQRFVDHGDLAHDLRRISEIDRKWYEGGVNEPPPRRGPPPGENSICLELWQTFMKPGYADSPPLKLSPDQEERMLSHILSLMKSPEIQNNNIDSDNATFLFRQRTISGSDSCPCGSGKSFSDCHGATMK